MIVMLQYGKFICDKVEGKFHGKNREAARCYNED